MSYVSRFQIRPSLRPWTNHRALSLLGELTSSQVSGGRTAYYEIQASRATHNASIVLRATTHCVRQSSHLVEWEKMYTQICGVISSHLLQMVRRLGWLCGEPQEAIPFSCTFTQTPYSRTNENGFICISLGLSESQMAIVNQRHKRNRYHVVLDIQVEFCKGKPQMIPVEISYARRSLKISVRQLPSLKIEHVPISRVSKMTSGRGGI